MNDREYNEYKKQSRSAGENFQKCDGNVQQDEFQ